MSTTPAHSLNLTDLLKDGRHFAERHGDKVHIIDSLTGNRYVTYASSSGPIIHGQMVETVLPTGVKVWTEVGIEANTVGGRPTLAFSPVIISEICQKIAEGGALTKICKLSNMPTYAQLRLWARSHPWIDEALNQARRDRAETMRDLALEAALEATDKNNAPAQALKTETYKWSASVDHEKYNPKTKVEATINTPTVIQVITGIDRTPVREVEEIPLELRQYEDKNDKNN